MLIGDDGIIILFLCPVFDVYISLREWYLNIITVESRIDTFLYVALNVYLLQYVHPAEEFEIDTIVAKLHKYSLCGFGWIYTLMPHAVDSRFYQ